MKANHFLSIIIFLIFSLKISKIDAQITTTPYYVYNNLSCDIVIHWRIVDNSVNFCPPLCNANNVLITAGNFITINCAVPNTSCIEVVMIKIGGVAIVPNPYVADNGSFGSSIFTGPTNDSGNCPTAVTTPCGFTWSMTYTGSSTTIAP